MRTEAELIQLLLDSEIVFFSNECQGICALSWQLAYKELITWEEKDIIHIVINSNKVDDIKYYPFYFPPYQWQPRREYLENLLKKYKI